MREAVGRIPYDIVQHRIKMYMALESFLRERNMLKRDTPDADGWTTVQCPWGEHSAAIAEPSKMNNWHGEFHCRVCTDRRRMDLVCWIADRAAEELDVA